MLRRISQIVVLSVFVFVLGLSVATSYGEEGPRRVLTRVNPQYPVMAHTMRLSGTVKVDALVAPNGTLKSLEVRGGHPLLVVAAQNAVRQWKWEPAPHETHEILEIKFSPE